MSRQFSCLRRLIQCKEKSDVGAHIHNWNNFITGASLQAFEAVIVKSPLLTNLLNAFGGTVSLSNGATYYDQVHNTIFIGPDYASGASGALAVALAHELGHAEVEATVSNEDIGYLKVGQLVEVKVDTFPFQCYGSLKGILVSISPDAEDENAAALDTDTPAGASNAQNGDPTHDPAAGPNTGYVYKIRIRMRFLMTKPRHRICFS